MKLSPHSSPWINPLADPELEALFLRHGTHEWVAKGTILSDERHNETTVFFVKEGLLSMAKYHHEVNKPSFMTLVPQGRFTNHAGFMMGRPVVQTIYANRRTLIYRLSYHKIGALLEADPGLARKFQHQCTRVIESTIDGLVATLMLPTETRMLLFLWTLLNSGGWEEKSGWISQKIKLTVSEFAQILFLTPMTIKRVRARWKTAGLCKKENNTLYYRASLFNDLKQNIEDY